MIDLHAVPHLDQIDLCQIINRMLFDIGRGVDILMKKTTAALIAIVVILMGMIVAVRYDARETAYNEALAAVQQDPRTAAEKINNLKQYPFWGEQRKQVNTMTAYSDVLQRYIKLNQNWQTKGVSEVAREAYGTLPKKPQRQRIKALSALVLAEKEQSPAMIQDLRNIENSYSNLQRTMPIQQGSALYHLNDACSKEMVKANQFFDQLQIQYVDIVYSLPDTPVQPPMPPSDYTSAGDQYVHGYYRRNGTYVQGYHRTVPNGTSYDNYSHAGNINPWTGKKGHKK